MTDPRRRTCKLCGKKDEEVGAITWRGYCEPCALQVAETAAMQLHEHRGPYFDRWRRGMVACAGGVMLDDRAEAT